LLSAAASNAAPASRANDARDFKNKYDRVFRVEPASNAKTAIDWVHRILKEERDIVISSRPHEATAFPIEKIRMAYVFYESGLSINVMYTVDDPQKRAVGFKLSEGMQVPAELASRFKFARQKSKLAGTIRGSYFDFKNELLTRLCEVSHLLPVVSPDRGLGAAACWRAGSLPISQRKRDLPVAPQVPAAGRQLSRARNAQDTGSHSFQQLPSPVREKAEATRITRVLSGRVPLGLPIRWPYVP